MIAPDTTNADRAWWALFALGDFVNRTGVHSAEEAIGDLLTDLLHLARAADMNPSILTERALAAMQAEVAEDENGDMDNCRSIAQIHDGQCSQTGNVVALMTPVYAKTYKPIATNPMLSAAFV